MMLVFLVRTSRSCIFLYYTSALIVYYISTVTLVFISEFFSEMILITVTSLNTHHALYLQYD